MAKARRRYNRLSKKEKFPKIGEEIVRTDVFKTAEDQFAVQRVFQGEGAPEIPEIDEEGTTTIIEYVSAFRFERIPEHILS